MIAEAVVAQYDKDFNNNVVKELELKIARLEREINKLADDFIEAEKGSVIRQKISEKSNSLSVQLTDLQIDLSKQRIACGIRLTVEGVLAWLKMFTLGNPLDEAYRERIIDTFLNSVYLYDNLITIYFNLTGDNKETVCYETEQGVEVLYFDDDPDDNPPGGTPGGGLSGSESSGTNEKTAPTGKGQGGSKAKAIGSVRISNASHRQVR